MNVEKILKAIEVATIAHERQRRKYVDEPYILHPIRVMKSLASNLEAMWTQQLNWMGTEEQEIDLFCIAALHDTLEDTTIESTVIAAFGDYVLSGVDWLTNPSKGSSLQRQERKLMDREHIVKAPSEIKLIKLLDRLDNLQSMWKDGHLVAPPDFANLYAHESELLVYVINDWSEVSTTVLNEAYKLRIKT